MTITLTPEVENRLLEEAERIGEDANRLAEELIVQGYPLAMRWMTQTI